MIFSPHSLYVENGSGDMYYCMGIEHDRFYLNGANGKFHIIPIQQSQDAIREFTLYGKAHTRFSSDKIIVGWEGMFFPSAETPYIRLSETGECIVSWDKFRELLMPTFAGSSVHKPNLPSLTKVESIGTKGVRAIDQDIQTFE